jgi:hypothetical protein
VFLIAWPFLAAVPGGVFLALGAWSRRRVPLVVGAIWLLYGIYEYGMKARVLCSGECNIRVDLLLIYPWLLVMSIWALVAVVRARRR